MFADAHVHLDRLKPKELELMLRLSQEANVEMLISVGIDLESSARAVSLAQSESRIWAAVGVHPWYARPLDQQAYHQLKKLATHPKVLFIGEVGLDLNRAPETLDVQITLLRQEIRLATEMGLPLNLHCRQAHAKLREVATEEGFTSLTGLIHGFDGDLAAMERCLELGLFVSFGRTLLNTGSEAEALVRRIPLDRLLLDTDSSVRSWRQNQNHPGRIAEIAQRVADLRGTSLAEIEQATYSNLCLLAERRKGPDH
ncbi:MAG: TatD family hydrolase [Deltaproteobacteria bacterium]|nr:TatD family hydrolase [Deltaproteobacteria bacterium]